MLRPIAVLSLVGLASCASHRPPDPGYRQRLQLELRFRTDTVELGRTHDSTWVLRNLTETSLGACLSERWGYNLIGTDDAPGRGHLVDHPWCHRAFTLDPGGTFEWSELLEIPGSIGAGPLRVNGWVYVVQPDNCDRYGCYGDYVSSDFVELTAVDEANGGAG